MDQLQSLLLLYGAILAFNVVFNAILWIKQGVVHYRLLCLTWLGYGIGFVLQGLAAESSYFLRVLAFSTIFPAATLLSLLLALVARLEFRWKPFVAIHAAGVGLSAALEAAGAGPNWMALPAVFTTSLPGLYVSAKTLVSRRGRLSTTAFFFAVSALAASLHGVDYAYFLDKPQFLLPGFTVALITVIAISTFSAGSVLETLTTENTRIKVEIEHRTMMTNAAKLASLGEMAGGVAHEINTPLATIQVNAEQLREMLGEGAIEPKLFDGKLATITLMATRIARITSGLRAFARDTGSEPLSSTLVTGVVGEALLYCAENFRERGVSVVPPPPTQARVQCRPTQISQVLLSLLGNALDAVAKTAGERRVRLDVRENRDTIQIAVADNGPGVPPELRERIFDPFFTTKGVGQGTGLGLSVSKGIVESHGGTIALEPSTVGACFVVTLPRA